MNNAGTGTTQNNYFDTWAKVKAAFMPSLQTVASFDGNGPLVPWSTVCNDHAYALVSRASAAYVTGTSSTCAQGTCTGHDALELVERLRSIL